MVGLLGRMLSLDVWVWVMCVWRRVEGVVCGVLVCVCVHVGGSGKSLVNVYACLCLER